MAAVKKMLKLQTFIFPNTCFISEQRYHLCFRGCYPECNNLVVNICNKQLTALGRCFLSWLNQGLLEARTFVRSATPINLVLCLLQELATKNACLWMHENIACSSQKWNGSTYCTLKSFLCHLQRSWKKHTFSVPRFLISSYAAV